jgi:serine/threonine protein phosphatase PrpC
MTKFFSGLFGKSDKNTEVTVEHGISDMPTQPLKSPMAENQPSQKSGGPAMFTVGMGSSVGMQRDHNEDALFSATTTLVTESTNYPFGLYIVADGMGGHAHGEKASEVAIRAMSNHVLSNLVPLLLETPAGDFQISEEDIMNDGVRSAHNAIIEYASGGGSTLTGVLLQGDQMTIAHIGDSRAYEILPNGEMKQLTTDHSLVKRLEDLGQITSDEAAIHPQRNVLYRALGQVESIDAELISSSTPKSGHLIICSDGLWGLVSDEAIAETVSSADSPQQACNRLVEAANTAGGPDNISVIIIQMPD